VSTPKAARIGPEPVVPSVVMSTAIFSKALKPGGNGPAGLARLDRDVLVRGHLPAHRDERGLGTARPEINGEDVPVTAHDASGLVFWWLGSMIRDGMD